MKNTNNRSKQTSRNLFNNKSVQLLFVAMFVFVGVTFIGGSFANKNTINGSCSVSPNPVPSKMSNFTLTGTNLGAGTIVNILISDSNATSTVSVQADQSGSLTYSTYSYYNGTSTVKMQTQVHNRWKVLATCSFNVF